MAGSMCSRIVLVVVTHVSLVPACAQYSSEYVREGGPRVLGCDLVVSLWRCVCIKEYECS